MLLSTRSSGIKILLIYPNADQEIIGSGDLGAIAEPLALEYIAAVCLSYTPNVRILDLRLHPGTLETELCAFQPDLVAVTGYSMHVLRMLEICEVSKNLVRGVRTIIGGHHATLLPEDFQVEQVDYIVKGEGTAPMRALLEQFDNQSPNAVPGVWRYGASGWTFGGEQGAFDLNSLPMPARNLCLHDRQHYFIDWMRPIALARTTVGCPYRCSFCSLWRIMDGRYYRRDVEGVADELRAIEEPYVFLVDDEPFVNAKRMDALADAISEGGIHKEYFSYCRIDTLLRNRSTMEKWVDIGLRRIFLGIEGITSREMVDFNKRLSIAQIEEGLAAARGMGIKVFASFIVSPFYTRIEFNQLTRFIERNRIDYPSFTILTPLPGTEDYTKRYHEITEWQPNGRPDWKKWDMQHLVLPSVLPRAVFEQEYTKLRRHFRGSYEIHQRKAGAARDAATTNAAIGVC